MDDDELNLDCGKKKKKKSKSKEAAAEGEGGEGAAPAGAEEEDELSLDLSLGKKKKKKAKARREDEFDGLEEGGGEEGGERGGGGLPWEGSDRDYTYEELRGEGGGPCWRPVAAAGCWGCWQDGGRGCSQGWAAAAGCCGRRAAPLDCSALPSPS